MEYWIEGIAHVTADHQKGAAKSTHKETDFYLDVSDNLDKNAYMDKQDILTKTGSQAVTQAFVQGLIGNIHFAHEKGFRDSAEHLRYIISELERGFSTVALVSKG